MEQNHLKNFGRGTYKQATFVQNYFECGSAVKEMKFKDFAIFSFGCHFVLWSKMI